MSAPAVCVRSHPARPSTPAVRCCLPPSTDRICKQHNREHSLVINGETVRFCQQVGARAVVLRCRVGVRQPGRLLDSSMRWASWQRAEGQHQLKTRAARVRVQRHGGMGERRRADLWSVGLACVLCSSQGVPCFQFECAQARGPLNAQASTTTHARHEVMGILNSTPASNRRPPFAPCSPVWPLPRPGAFRGCPAQLSCEPGKRGVVGRPTQGFMPVSRGGGGGGARGGGAGVWGGGMLHLFAPTTRGLQPSRKNCSLCASRCATARGGGVPRPAAPRLT